MVDNKVEVFSGANGTGQTNYERGLKGDRMEDRKAVGDRIWM